MTQSACNLILAVLDSDVASYSIERLLQACCADVGATERFCSEHPAAAALIVGLASNKETVQRMVKRVLSNFVEHIASLRSAQALDESSVNRSHELGMLSIAAGCFWKHDDWCSCVCFAGLRQAKASIERASVLIQLQPALLPRYLCSSDDLFGALERMQVMHHAYDVLLM
jgi:hypothetical protein